MPIGTQVKRNTYHDSVSLMRVSSYLAKLEGVHEAFAMMGTEINKALWADAGLLTEEAKTAGPNDLVVVVKAEQDSLVAHALKQVDTLLVQEERVGQEEQVLPRTLMEALSQQPDANIVLISTPGPYAATEAYRALMEGRHVFMFSDNVTVEDEVMLKELATERGLLMMGPDCGTAIINGHPLGFANVVHRGPIGIVAASGTGLQEVSSLIHRLGSGVSQAIGVGGRDLSEAVGGKMMKLGLDALADDPLTKVVVLISKPPAPNIAELVLEQARGISRPVVVNFLGGDLRKIEKHGAVPAFTLEDAGVQAVALVNGKEAQPVFFSRPSKEINKMVKRETSGMTDRQRWVRGLFSGGTYCAEAQLLLRDMTGRVYSNVPLKPNLKVGINAPSHEHTLIDFGTDEYTAGRPHPMIDFRTRTDALKRQAKDPETAVILLDVVLAFGAHEDPASELVPAILQAKETAQKDARPLAVVASICGTDEDIQNRQNQAKRLEEAGVIIMDSNAQAARLAGLIATRQTV